MRYGIIYKVTSQDGRVYVGQTVKALCDRKAGHKIQAKKNDRRTPFQAALLDEGFDNFKWEQIDTAENQAELDAKEKHWIAYYNSLDPKQGYNTQTGGKSNYAFTENTRRKMSESHNGQIPWNKDRKASEEERRKNSEAQKGKTLGENTRKKISKALKGKNTWSRGRKASAETKRKMSETRRGRKLPPHTAEQRRKQSEAATGRIPWNKGKKGISEETRRKLSEAHKGKPTWNKGKKGTTA